MLTAPIRHDVSTCCPKKPMPFTVGTRLARPIGFREFSGSSTIFCASTVVPTSEVFGSRSGVPPITSTVSLT